MTLVTFGSEQYVWKADGAKSYADPDGPPVARVIQGSQFTLPKASVTVIRGKIERESDKREEVQVSARTKCSVSEVRERLGKPLADARGADPSRDREGAVSSKYEYSSVIAVCACLASAANAQNIVVDAAPSHAVNSFSPPRALGGAIDRLRGGATREENERNTERLLTDPVLKEIAGRRMGHGDLSPEHRVDDRGVALESARHLEQRGQTGGLFHRQR